MNVKLISPKRKREILSEEDLSENAGNMSFSSFIDNICRNILRSHYFPIIFMLCLFIVTILLYFMLWFLVYLDGLYEQSKLNVTTNETSVTLQETIITPNETRKVKMRVVMPPGCPPFDHQELLSHLCDDYVFKSVSCTPEDFSNEEKHKVPTRVRRHIKPHDPNDPRTSIVSYVTVGFLLVSLTAAFLELYRAKKQVPAKAKAPLTRKCSLADLTIMKHQRKELVRRDSILESPEEGKQPAHFKRPPPLQRSSSTPAEPISELSAYNFSRSFDSRRGSTIDPQTFPSYPVQEPTSSRYTLDGRNKGSILDRRSSTIDGKLIDRFDPTGRRISIDITSSPERKHHSRLVHRH